MHGPIFTGKQRVIPNTNRHSGRSEAKIRNPVLDYSHYQNDITEITITNLKIETDFDSKKAVYSSFYKEC